MKFPCTGCGICCTKVGIAVKNAMLILAEQEVQDSYVKEISEFPHQTKPDGSCEHLQPDHSCGIYLTRPDICDVAKTWEKHHSKAISKSDFFLSTAMLCNQLITEEVAGNNFFIDTDKMSDEQKSRAVTT